MKGITQKIESVMTGQTNAGPLLSFLLRFLAAIYGMAVRLRSVLYDHGILRSKSLPCAVISVGNLTVGGTGKTPMTIYLAQLLRDAGYKTAVISRGYKGRAENTGGIVSDGGNVLLGPVAAGDEPFMMANRLRGIPVLVGADRFKIGRRAVEKFSPDIILFDDAFQHRRLKRDVNIVLVDDKSLFGNGYLLPRGILREPVSGLLRGDLFVLTRSSDNSPHSADALTENVSGKPIFKSFHEPYVIGIFNGTDACAAGGFSANAVHHSDFLKTSKVFVFSGIARNDEFMSTVMELAGEVSGAIGFKDHHQYTESDFQLILGRAKKCTAQYLVTTEKDYVKIAGKMQSPMDIVVVGIRVSFKDDEMKFAELIKDKVANISN